MEDARAVRRATQRAYALQRAELDREHAGRGFDIFVSPFDIVTDQKRVEYSYCTWAEGVAAWLPRTECIAFTGKNGEKRWILIVRWKDVDAICADALEPVPGIHPPRFKTKNGRIGNSCNRCPGPP